MEIGVVPLMQGVHRTPWIYDGRLPDRHTWRHPLLAASTARTSVVAMELLVFAGFGKRCFLPRWRPASVVSTGRHLQCVRSATVAGCLRGLGFNLFDPLSAPLSDGFPLRPDDPVTFENLAHSWRCLGRGAGVASIAAGTGSRLVCLNPAITHQQQSKAQGKNFCSA